MFGEGRPANLHLRFVLLGLFPLVFFKLMGSSVDTSPADGFSLIELLVVLALLALCLAGGVAALGNGLSDVETRGAAQDWQAAAAWAQVAVIWQGGSKQVAYDSGALALSHDSGTSGDDLGKAAPVAAVMPNVARWRAAKGVVVTFGGSLASPDSGGSLWFHGNGGGFRVVVRPESGLTTRNREGERP